jgi:hypothetical protein
LHAPYCELQENISTGGMLHELAGATGKWARGRLSAAIEERLLLRIGEVPLSI